MTDDASAVIPQPDASRRIWERLPGESPQAYESFIIYRDLGIDERSIRAAAEKRGVSVTLLAKWSRKWRWVERCQFYDADQVMAKRARKRTLRTKKQAEHLAAAEVLLQQALTRVMLTPLVDKKTGHVVYKPNTNPPEPYLVPANSRDLDAAANALDKAIKHQRLAMGLPTEHTKQDTQLREALQQTLHTQNILREIIESRLCTDCRAAVAADLQRVASMHIEVVERIDE